MYENLRKCPTFINRRNAVLLHDNKTTFSKNHAGKNIRFKQVSFIASNIFTRLCTEWFPSFSFSPECSEWENIFPRWSGENVCGKLIEHKTRGIHILPDELQEVIQNNGRYTNGWN